MNVTFSNDVERNFREKAVPNFSHAALGPPYFAHCAFQRALLQFAIEQPHRIDGSDKGEASCRRKYVREETLEAQFTELLGQLNFDDGVLEWVRDALHASHADERREHEDAIKRHQAEYKRLNDRIHVMYVDKLDGLVDAAFFEKMSNQWRDEQNRCQRQIERYQNADKSYLEEGVALLDLARNAQRLFSKQEPREKRRLLNFLLSNCTWKDGHVVATFRQPFDILAETVVAEAQLATGEMTKSAKSEIWLGDLDSNQSMHFTWPRL
jgi:hypothetical protein